MKKTIKVSLLLFIFIIAALFIFIYERVNVGLEDLKGKGELIDSVVSPDENYIANTYLINEGGATMSFQIRVAIDSYINESNHEKTFDDYTIYWEYGPGEKIKVSWINEDTVKINDTTLNIFHDTYNWKKDR